MRGITLLLVLTAVMNHANAGAPPASAVRLNTVGFLPTSTKQATVAVEQSGSFVIIDNDSETEVLRGKLGSPRRDRDTTETVCIADFSALKAEGVYRLIVDGVAEPVTFAINRDIFADAFRTVVRGMYLWRCGTSVKGEYKGSVFVQQPCHLDDGWLDHATGRHEHRDGTGGWHDAGDYNKYIVNAAVTVGSMLRAWEDFQPALKSVRLDIPESGGPIPDFLAEIKWETDWMLKMQNEDGSVFHKLSTLGFGGMIMPSEEKEPRYFTDWSSAATAGFVATLASTARAFSPFDAAHAERCLSAARRSHAFLTAHPADKQPEQSQFSTGAYTTEDPDDRLWAAAELWETTGDAELLKELERRIREMGTKFDEDFGWGKVKNLGLLTYAISRREGRDPALVARVERDLVAMADRITATASRGGYGRPLGSIYYWGCHGGVAMQTLLLQAAHRQTGNTNYRTTALHAVDHLLGRNYFGRSMVTGVGAHPPKFPHDRRSAGDDVSAPWPGYLVGGPQKGAKDWDDVESRYEVNEIAINWNGAFIYALAGFLEPTSE